MRCVIKLFSFRTKNSTRNKLNYNNRSGYLGYL